MKKRRQAGALQKPMKKRRQFLFQLTAGLLFTRVAHSERAPSSFKRAVPPRPYGPTPSARQLRWHELEFYGFVHFTINTFTDKEWGYGDEDPALFNPTAFDADVIVSSSKDSVSKGSIITCKHHYGFCLLLTQTTYLSVYNRLCRDGNGAVETVFSE